MCPPKLSRLAEPTPIPASSPPLDTLQDIRHYSKCAVLYRGSISTVELAVHNPTGKQVVLKCYHKAKMQDKHYHKLDKEVRSMAALSGPYVAALYAWFSDDSHVWLVLEYCEGGDLFKAMASHGGRLDAHYVCVEVIAPLLRVLEKCAALNVIHRDIKPENLFLTKMYKLKLGDWGLATNSAEEIPFSRSGTLDYMSPEALRNPVTPLQEGPSVHPAALAAKSIKPYSSKVDVWAAGILAYELVVGRPPFEVESESQTAQLIMNSDRIPFPAQHCPLWADFVRTALIKDPEARPCAGQLMNHLWITSNLQGALHSASAAGRKSSKATLLTSLPLPPPLFLLPPHQICSPGFKPSPQMPGAAQGACSVARPSDLHHTSPAPEQCATAVPRTTLVAFPQQQANKVFQEQGNGAVLNSSGHELVGGILGGNAALNSSDSASVGGKVCSAPAHSSSHDVFMECYMAAQRNQAQQQQQQQQQGAGFALHTSPAAVGAPLWECTQPSVGTGSAHCTTPGAPEKPVAWVPMPPTPPRAPLMTQHQHQQQSVNQQLIMSQAPYRLGAVDRPSFVTTSSATGARPQQQQQSVSQAPYRLGAPNNMPRLVTTNSATGALHPEVVSQQQQQRVSHAPYLLSAKAVPGASPPRPTTPPRTHPDLCAPTSLASPPNATHPNLHTAASHEQKLHHTATQPYSPRTSTLLATPPKALTLSQHTQQVANAGNPAIPSILPSSPPLPRGQFIPPWSPTKLVPAARSPLSRSSSACSGISVFSNASSRDNSVHSIHPSISVHSSSSSSSSGHGSVLPVAVPWGVHTEGGAQLRVGVEDGSSGLEQGMAGLHVRQPAKAAPAAHAGLGYPA